MARKKGDSLLKKLLPEFSQSLRKLDEEIEVNEFYRIDGTRLSEIIKKIKNKGALVFLRQRGIEIYGNAERDGKNVASFPVGMLVAGDILRGDYLKDVNLYLVTFTPTIAYSEKELRSATIKPNLVDLLRQYIE